MPDRLRLLLTITDGVDIVDREGRDFQRAVEQVQRQQVISLSCGIGEREVEHERLTLLAYLTGGQHVVVLGSIGVAQAVSDLTSIYLARERIQIARTQDKLAAQREFEAVHVRYAIDAFILIDCSWSMLGQADNGRLGDPQKLPRTKDAAQYLIGTLNARYDRVGVARFCGTYERLQRLSADFPAATRAIQRINGGPSTALFAAIAHACNEFTT